MFDFIKTIRENLKDPKKKSLTLLGIYLLFFIFVFVVISNSTPMPTPEYNEVNYSKSDLGIYKEMSNYEYNISYISDLGTVTIDGIYLNNESLFNYNGNKYYYDGSLYILDEIYYYNSVIDYDITKLFNDNLLNIINNLEEFSKTEYKDGTVNVRYLMNSNIFYLYYYGIQDESNIKCSVDITKSDNTIKSISIDLSSLNIDIKQINIEYNNVGNIKSLDFNKDNYIYKEY